MSTLPKETDDDFFGNQDEEMGDMLHLTFAQTHEALPVDQKADGLAEREARAVAEQFRNLGYHEAYDEAKDAKLQEGFEEGYKQCFHAALNIGELLGDATSPLGDDLTGTDNSKRVARLVRTFLDNFQQDEDPMKTPESLAVLAKQMNDFMMQKKS